MLKTNLFIFIYFKNIGFWSRLGAMHGAKAKITFPFVYKNSAKRSMVMAIITEVNH